MNRLGGGNLYDDVTVKENCKNDAQEGICVGVHSSESSFPIWRVMTLDGISNNTVAGCSLEVENKKNNMESFFDKVINKNLKFKRLSQ